jgi:hypothetical protein
MIWQNHQGVLPYEESKGLGGPPACGWGTGLMAIARRSAPQQSCGVPVSGFLALRFAGRS